MSYRVILMDPPWPEQGAGKIKRGADRHYPLIKKKEEILRVILQSGSWDPDPEGSHLYMWVTNNYLPWGLWLMEALGYRYVTNVVWIKTRKPPFDKKLITEIAEKVLEGDLVGVVNTLLRYGIGQWFRGGHELLLVGTKGDAPAKMRTDRKDLPGTVAAEIETDEEVQVIAAPRGRHSAKPEVFHELIESRSQGPYIEFFAREARSGWSAWGNEV